MITAGSDPRIQREGSAHDVRPVVARASRGVPAWILVAAAIIAGVLLFSILDARRRALTAPAIRPRVADAAAMPSSPPALYIPPVPQGSVAPTVVPGPATRPTPAPSSAPTAPSFPQPQQPAFLPSQPQPMQLQPQPKPQEEAGPVLVIDTTTSDGGGAPLSTAPTAGEGNAASVAVASGSARARANQLRNRPTTVPQGTLIPAVLETALDSTRPGQARALVSRDVRGFDGSRVLIPRGSRLFGEYRADLAPGQNRAFVQWTRLVRPDGVTVAIGSPAADALGRAGIKGKVNSHFLERFGAAILQSTLDIGVNLATSQLGDSPVVVVPNPTQSAVSPVIGSRQVQPTLKVKQGEKVTVFVARDLDFTAVESKRR